MCNMYNMALGCVSAISDLKPKIAAKAKPRAEGLILQIHIEKPCYIQYLYI